MKSKIAAGILLSALLTVNTSYAQRAHNSSVDDSLKSEISSRIVDININGQSTLAHKDKDGKLDFLIDEHFEKDSVDILSMTEIISYDSTRISYGKDPKYRLIDVNRDGEIDLAQEYVDGDWKFVNPYPIIMKFLK